MRKRVLDVGAAFGLLVFIVGVVALVLLPARLRVQTGQQGRLSLVAGPTWLASPGAVVMHTLTISNSGGADTVEITVSGNAWELDAPSSVPIAANATAPVSITVRVPFTATSGMVDAAVITATARESGRSVGRTLVSSTSGEFTGAGYVGCRFDLNRDGVVDDDDVASVGELFNAEPPDQRYDPLRDFDHDGRIGAADVQAVAGRIDAACAVMPETDTAALVDAVTVEGVRRHLDRFQEIAEANGGNRAAARPGYNASAAYVREQLAAAGYNVALQEFQLTFWEELEPPVFERVSPDPKVYERNEYAIFRYSGSGDVTAVVQPVELVLPPGPDPNTSTSGCEKEDFADFTAGNIALIQRGSCTFSAKVVNAQDAGAVGVLIFNEGQQGRTGVISSRLGGAAIDVPVLGTSFAVGNELAGMIEGGGEVTLHMFTKVGTVERPTSNVIASTPHTVGGRVVVLGAHLDSVNGGPGINDNGSGSAVILEIALQMARLDIVPRNEVRFGFWAAEERGLLGSEHYVEQLSQAERDEIMLDLNFDMVGSPNYVRFVYDGERLAMPGGAHPGSEEIEAVFVKYLAGNGLASEPIALGGRSDHAPFSLAGIPAGGLFTGAESRKTVQQAAVYGGTAEERLDPCYHRACDMTDNLNWEVLGQMADAAAHTTFVYAMDGREVMNRVPGSVPSGMLETLDYKGPVPQR